MAKCDHCGNEYDRTFRVTQDSRTMTFDSFECAIHAMAPICAHCKCRIVGHGVEQGGNIYCCAHYVKQHGVTALRDRSRRMNSKAVGLAPPWSNVGTARAAARIVAGQIIRQAQGWTLAR
jgi:phage terminase large subunit GpA-like protein